MSLTISALFLLLMPLVAQETAVPRDAQGWLTKGVEDYKRARYVEAAIAFQKALDLNPNDGTARLYLATAWVSQYIPGAVSPENLELASKAEVEFSQVLQVEPNNTTALESLAALTYQQAQGIPDQDQKFRKLDEAASWYDRLSIADPHNMWAFYSLAVIDWVKWYAAWTRARMDLGRKPEEPGPLPEPIRQQLKQQYSSIIEHGVSNLEKALQIDPQFDDAMAYMNLLVRERADLADTKEEYRRQVEIADHWVEKALETKKMKAPPPAPANAPQRVRVGEGVQQFNLIRKVNPLYPPLAHQARIQGTVRFTAIIGRDGHVQHLQLISGHPLLVEAAREAVSQWEYKPTLLNGQPVEVVTSIDVNFTLHE